MKNIYKKIKDLKRSRDYNKEMKEHYKELSKAGTSELQFEKLNVLFLHNLLSEIQTITKDELVLAIIENGKNRHELDKLIHARSLFTPNELKGFNNN